MTIQIVILAAGQGKRMHSALPKVLHHLAGRPLLEHVIATAYAISPLIPPIVIYGKQGEILQTTLANRDINWVHQEQQLGTGHALMQALPQLNADDHVLVLYGDVPLISKETLKKLVSETPVDQVGMLTANVNNPSGYGRIKRDQKHEIIGIVEEKDANQAERAIHEINPGIYFVPARYLKKWLPAIQNKNVQNEYYLTDIIELAVKEKIKIHAVQPESVEEILGVNDHLQLAQLERHYQRQYAEKLMRQGVTICDPNRLDIRGEVIVGQDVVIDVNVILEGNVQIGDGCRIGAHSILRHVVLGPKVDIKPHSMLDGAEIAEASVIGPFARLRPGSVIASRAHIGNFVEIKNSQIGMGTKINHLSYVGDADVGNHVNIGAGTITCNYDGVNKHQTIIDDKAFIGSCTQLVAPVHIGEGATIGAGSTITRDAPAHQLTLSRTAQQTIQDWQPPPKK